MSSIYCYNKRSSSKKNIYIKKCNLEKLRQAIPNFGTKLWNEITGRMRDGKKVCIEQNLMSVLFKKLKEKDGYRIP